MVYHCSCGESWPSIPAIRSTVRLQSRFNFKHHLNYTILSHRPTLSHVHPFHYNGLRPFGCLAFVHDRHRQSKVGPIAKRFIFVGIKPNARAWRLWDENTKRIFVTGDADFHETIFPAADKDHAPNVSSLNLNNNNLCDILTTIPDHHTPTNTSPDLTSDTHTLLTLKTHKLLTLKTATPLTPKTTRTHCIPQIPPTSH